MVSRRREQKHYRHYPKFSPAHWRERDKCGHFSQVAVQRGEGQLSAGDLALLEGKEAGHQLAEA